MEIPRPLQLAQPTSTGNSPTRQLAGQAASQPEQHDRVDPESGADASGTAIAPESGSGPVSAWKLAFLIVLAAWWILLRRSHRLAREAERLTRQHRALQFANSRLKSESEQLRERAVNDPLTGILNRRAFAASLRELIEDAARYGRQVFLIILDLDHFKSINDRHGHLAGDSALKLVTGVVHEHLVSADLFGRFGGDEFLIACARYDKKSATALADTIREAVAAAASGHESPFPQLTLSVGVAFADAESGYSADNLFERADAALYEAKRSGRNRVIMAQGGTLPQHADGPATRRL